MMGRYLPQLDGLRTVAVLLVIGTHTGIVLGGYVGVDIFFVLSGYLITTILVEQHESGRWNVRAFYARRMRRLYPALVVMLLLTIPFDGLLIPGSNLHVALMVLAGATYTTDFTYIYDPGAVSGLTHLWSLAVEEQFYLMWPLALPLVLRCRRGVLALLMLTVGMLTWLLVGPSQTMLVLYGRGGVVLVGCLLALALRHRQFGTQPAAFCVLGIAVLMVTVRSQIAPGPSVLVALMSAGLIASIIHGGWVACALAWKPLVWLGQRSYGIYLWHVPILSLLTNNQFSNGPRNRFVMFAVAVAGSTGLAALSYRYVEMPIRNGAFRRSRGGVRVPPVERSNGLC